jgi:uncharacterized cupredoxin-like copper-binding protein
MPEREPQITVKASSRVFMFIPPACKIHATQSYSATFAKIKLGHPSFQSRPLRVKTGQYPKNKKNILRTKNK